MRAAIITIGDEILIGQTLDTNSAFMGEQLNALGIDIVETVSISDEAEAIKSTIKRLEAKVGLILVTGGLGPTKDDITKNTLAKYYDCGFVFNQAIYKNLEAYFKKRGRAVLPEHKDMAMMPEKCEVLINTKGTAAAMWFNENGTQLVSMPGVPYEMKEFMNTIIIPRLKEIKGGEILVNRHIFTAGKGETMIAEKIKSIVDAFDAQTKIAYLPTLGTVKLRVSATGADKLILNKKLDGIANEMKEALGSNFVCYGRTTLQAFLGNMLKEKAATLSTAESCTGGMIAHKITSISGSSAYYKGSIVAYDNAVKQAQLGVSSSYLETYGAVSEQVVSQMAKGVLSLLNTDYAIATSGIAGPDGGTPTKPVGTIWVAFASKNRVLTKKYQLGPHRDINIAVTVNLALNDLRRFILSEAKDN